MFRRQDIRACPGRGKAELMMETKFPKLTKKLKYVWQMRMKEKLQLTKVEPAGDSNES